MFQTSPCTDAETDTDTGPETYITKKTEKAQSLYFLRFKFKIVLSL